MSINVNIKDIFPPILFKIGKKIYCEKIQTGEPLPMRNRNGNRMIVIGNGPSLNKTIELYGDVVRSTECMMVNFSASTSLFEFVRPSVYLLVDPGWFSPSRDMKSSVNSCIDDIIGKTKWQMTMVVPSFAKGTFTIERLHENKEIDVLFYNTNFQMPKNMSKFEAWNKNLISPPGQTVLNTCVWLSLYWGYSETFLVGADSSFLADEFVDQETNEVYTFDKHFYCNDEIYKDKNLFDTLHRRVIPARFHEELRSVALAFEGYWDMREYADWKGSKVYNASEYSWIDAFERKKLS